MTPKSFRRQHSVSYMQASSDSRSQINSLAVLRGADVAMTDRDTLDNDGVFIGTSFHVSSVGQSGM